ncbi:MAG: cytochrome c [Oricola sp.]|nr:cytochrome c [Oricola sp.]
MKLNLPKIFVLGFFALGAAVLLSKFFRGEPETAIVAVSMPELSSEASVGQILFNNNCASCHGDRASGTDNGPPLIHDIYNPGHHSDDAFYLAAANGVVQHHWPFGNMPKQEHVAADEVAKIVQYVHELQTANGITYKPHNM